MFDWHDSLVRWLENGGAVLGIKCNFHILHVTLVLVMSSSMWVH